MRYLRFVLPLLAAAGCESRIFQIRLEPTSAGLERTLTVWREKGDEAANLRFPDEELERLAQLYPQRVSEPADLRQTFRGVFATAMPPDVGGAGTYSAIVTPLGTAYWYLERFRGTDDPDGEWYDRRAAVDRLVDLAVGWFDEQMASSPHREKVRIFLHQPFRQDARNVAFYLWLATSEDVPAQTSGGIAAASRRPPDALLAGAQYLVEHRYLEASEAAAIGALALDEPAAALRLIRERLARKCGFEQSAADEVFSFLIDYDAVYASWRAYLARTPEYAQQRKAWKPDPTDPTGGEPEPLNVVESLIDRAITPGLIDDRDQLRLSLVTQAEPHESNGEYDSSTGTIVWRKRLHGRRELPRVCYAAWTRTDEAFQAKHFARTALSRDELAKFASLFGRLSAEHQAQVAAHLQSLEPGDALRGRARDFRLVGTADSAAQEIAAALGEILYDAL